MKDVKDLLDGSNYNFLSYIGFITKYNIKTNCLAYCKLVSALKNISGKSVRTIKNSLPWKTPPTTCSLPREFAKRFIRFWSKQRLPHQWKARESGLMRSFFKCTSELAKYLSSTSSMHYGNEAKGISI